jgi:hypothetical protein
VIPGSHSDVVVVGPGLATRYGLRIVIRPDGMLFHDRGQFRSKYDRNCP